MEVLRVTSPCFVDGGLIPVRHTGHGEDRSPELTLHGLCREAVSMAILLDDIDHPIPAYNHWVIWNLPAASVIPGNLPPGASAPGGAIQGVGYGKNRYRGPKPPFHWSHRYRFHVYVLDCFLELPSTARKRALKAAMQGHILQQAVLTGHYR